MKPLLRTLGAPARLTLSLALAVAPAIAQEESHFFRVPAAPDAIALRQFLYGTVPRSSTS